MSEADDYDDGEEPAAEPRGWVEAVLLGAVVLAAWAVAMVPK